MTPSFRGRGCAGPAVRRYAVTGDTVESGGRCRHRVSTASHSLVMSAGSGDGSDSEDWMAGEVRALSSARPVRATARPSMATGPGSILEAGGPGAATRTSVWRTSAAFGLPGEGAAARAREARRGAEAGCEERQRGVWGTGVPV